MNHPSTLVIDLAELNAADLHRAGGKAVALGKLASSGTPIPPGLCVTTTAYDRYLDETGLRQRLPLLLERKPFSEMRWDELWDLGLRLRTGWRYSLPATRTWPSSRRRRAAPCSGCR